MFTIRYSEMFHLVNQWINRFRAQPWCCHDGLGLASEYCMSADNFLILALVYCDTDFVQYFVRATIPLSHFPWVHRFLNSLYSIRSVCSLYPSRVPRIEILPLNPQDGVFFMRSKLTDAMKQSCNISTGYCDSADNGDLGLRRRPHEEETWSPSQQMLRRIIHLSRLHGILPRHRLPRSHCTFNSKHSESLSDPSIELYQRSAEVSGRPLPPWEGEEEERCIEGHGTP